jgi:hypothetical protein
MSEATSWCALSGRCYVCGCTELNPCLFGGGDGNPLATCAWVDLDHTLCSNVRCVAVMPLAKLLGLRISGASS